MNRIIDQKDVENTRKLIRAAKRALDELKQIPDNLYSETHELVGKWQSQDALEDALKHIKEKV